ncbi:hypothetical protein B1992_14510 [Pseudoxanthomonas broegbernensis]|uniref:DUF2065 domain-containing protein n=1 Tax=Pseudoxanthomonas broegbernensis TaxID=83619 RepID=A0A7V8GK21_9GAMM|nr:DUF2065 domain-containing protein [Pseudoxanthomonas broegbernensis]KAF1684773.1 hypothetical protein B1992_14510 [Pseudoxanthomonas broegbernensis]MBB6064194.1 hypothetical protein [Pseudoxanthomonas broegbernensis]
MPAELVSALCLVVVIEGLFLFTAPALWRRTMEQFLSRPPSSLRRLGAGMLVVGLAALWWSRT